MAQVTIPRTMGGTLLITITIVSTPTVTTNVTALGRDGTLTAQKVASMALTQLAPAWSVSIDNDAGTVNLTGILDTALAMYFKNISNGVTTQGQGTLHVAQANPGIVSYQPVANDVNVGMYRVTLWITFSNGPAAYDLGLWSVEP